MKKVIPSILITLILVNLFAPFTLGIKNGIPAVKKLEAEAAFFPKPFVVKRTQTSVTYELDIMHRSATVNHWAGYIVTDKPGVSIDLNYNSGTFILPSDVKAMIPQKEIDLENPTQVLTVDTTPKGAAAPGEKYYDEDGDDIMDGQYIFELSPLSKGTEYFLSIVVSNGDKKEATRSWKKFDIPIKTLADGEEDTGPETGQYGAAGDGMPECLYWFGLSMSGCIANLIYGLVFKPTSALFELAGKFFDFSFFYSVNDTSYRNPFVEEGWGIVRDFVNLFFIFVLLWIAFSTILNLHGFKTKEMIMNVVIIGLLMNFSLFATRVIVDTSNILARVFYSNVSVNEKDKTGPNKDIVNKLGDNGEKQISAAIVDKFDPQSLIIKANETKLVMNNGSITSEGVDSHTGVTNGTFILITLLSSAVNVIGMIVFLTSGIIFIARVVGLWIAMILVPLAFFSYMVPAMQDVDTIGWKKWWPNTLKLAFLAPIFMFFMYLIIKFVDAKNFITLNVGSGVTFIIAVIVPFAFIIVLMNKAKGLAVKFSGDIGAAITKAGNMVGGLAVGAGVGVAAMGLRQTVGRGANYLDKKNWLNDAAAGKKGRMAQFLTKTTGLKTLTSKTARGSFDVRQTVAGNAFSKETGMNLNKGASFVGLGTKNTVGGYVGAQQRKVEKEKKFGESLGYDHHQYDDLADEIAAKEDVLAKFKTQKNMTVTDPNGETRVVDRNSSEFKAEVAKQEYDVKGLQKKQERVKTGRQMEYALTQRRKSGKIYDVDKTDKAYKKAKKEAEENPNDPVKQQVWKEAQKYRDDLGNIKKFGHAEKARMRGLGKTLWEGLEGGLKGAAVGAVAGSVVPIIGTAFGAGVGSIAGAIRNMALHSGTTNRQAGNKDFHKEEFKDTYNPGSGTPAHSEPAHEEHPAPGGGDPHDNHGPAH